MQEKVEKEKEVAELRRAVRRKRKELEGMMSEVSEQKRVPDERSNYRFVVTFVMI